MERAPPPLPSVYASCPLEGEILGYYQECFEAVYLMFHPFFRSVSIDDSRFCPEKWPDKLEMLSGCVPMNWQQVLFLTGLGSVREIDVGLRTCTLSILQSLCDEDSAQALIDIQERGVIHPGAGQLSPFLENRLITVLQKLGYDWLWIGDEFCTERKLHWYQDLLNSDILPSGACMFTHDHQILVTTHWDSHCSFLCGSKANIERILKMEAIEGFYCSPKTQVYWGLYEL
jgi:hypothetical protein